MVNYDGKQVVWLQVCRDIKSSRLTANCLAKDFFVELDLSVGRHSGVPLETRGAVARYAATARGSSTSPND